MIVAFVLFVITRLLLLSPSPFEEYYVIYYSLHCGDLSLPLRCVSCVSTHRCSRFLQAHANVAILGRHLVRCTVVLYGLLGVAIAHQGIGKVATKVGTRGIKLYRSLKVSNREWQL